MTVPDVECGPGFFSIEIAKMVKDSGRIIAAELQDEKQFTLKKGSTYLVSDELSSHRSISETRVKLLIIDVDILRQVYE